MHKLADEIMTQPTMKKVKLGESENKDRLSDLPESLIILIMSSLDSKHAVQTCVLSQRYKDLWKNLHALVLCSSYFPTYELFNKFLSLRDSSMAVQTLNFTKDNVGHLGRRILKRSVNYAISHKVQRLGVKHRFNGHISQIPATVFSCQTLTHLKLSFYNARGHAHFPKSLNLPALTDLELQYFEFGIGDNDCAEPFSTLNSLDTLLIICSSVSGAKTLFISSSTLVNLTIYDLMSRKIDLCTPSLCKFVFTGSPYRRVSGSNVSSLKHLDIDVKLYSRHECIDVLNWLLDWLLELTDIKSLTVSTTILQILFLIPDLLKIKLRSLHNLKSLKVTKEELSDPIHTRLMDAKLQKAKSEKEAVEIRKAFELARSEPSSLIPIVDFLLQNSPLAKVDFIECSRQ